MSRLVFLIGWSFAYWLHRLDRAARQPGTAALWIPGLWLGILGSRPVAFWLGGGGGNTLEGSPINVVFNMSLIVGAFVVLMRRGFDWGRFASDNRALALIYFYFLISAVWSQFPVSTFKRWVNDFGGLMIALVLLTEKNPAESVRAVYTRVAFVLFPMSFLLIRYVPAIGRQFSKAGEPMFTGVTPHKNSLGQIVMVLGLVMLWEILDTRKKPQTPELKRAQKVRIGVLLLGVYLLVICRSATALVCFIGGAGLLLARERIARFKNPRRFAVVSILSFLGVMFADKYLGISEAILEALGRNATLTGRTDIWAAVRGEKVNFLFGSGFRGFWETAAGVSVWEELGINRLFTAHNGYLEAYLNGGIIGVTLLFLMLIAGGNSVLDKFFTRQPLGDIGLPFFVIALAYNNSESDFFILEPLWFTWLLVAARVPLAQAASAAAVATKRSGFRGAAG